MLTNLSVIEALCQGAGVLQHRASVMQLLSTPTNVVVEVYESGMRKAVVKHSRSSDGDAAIVDEAKALRHLSKFTASIGGVHIPEFFTLSDICGRPALVCEAVDGMANDPALVSDHVLIKVSKWLMELASWSACNQKVTADYISDVITQTELNSAVGPNWGAESSNWNWSGLETVPLITCHHDLSYQNVLLGEDNQIFLVDWALWADKGFAAFDLLDFLLYREYRDTQDYRVAFIKLVSAHKDAVTWRVVTDYMKSLDIPLGTFASLLRFSLMKRLGILASAKSTKAQKKSAEIIGLLKDTDWRKLSLPATRVR